MPPPGKLSFVFLLRGDGGIREIHVIHKNGTYEKIGGYPEIVDHHHHFNHDKMMMMMTMMMMMMLLLLLLLLQGPIEYWQSRSTSLEAI